VRSIFMTARRWLAAVWIVLAATAAVGHVADVPLAIVGAWFGALLMLGGTGSTAKAQADERLERPRTYRTVAAIGFAIPLGAALLTWVPHHADWTTILSPYFVLVAWLAYRAVVARGPRPAMLAMTVSLFAWLPFMVLMCIGCKCARYDPPPPHWTETVSWLALLATQLMNGLTVAAALISFARRTEEVPEARLHAQLTRVPACSP
jgi:hypothetical protein